jgi:hypothetical protein
MKKQSRFWSPILFDCAFAVVGANAQSFRVQCPTSTITHPNAATNNSEPPYVGPSYAGASGYPAAQGHVNGAIKCQQISGGDGYATMGDGTQTYMFSFGPLSGLADIANGLPGTEFPNVFNNAALEPNLQPGDPATTDGASDMGSYSAGNLGAFSFNGAIGQVVDADAQAAGLCGGTGKPSCIDGHVDPRQIMDVGVMNGNIPAPRARDRLLRQSAKNCS